MGSRLASMLGTGAATTRLAEVLGPQPRAQIGLRQCNLVGRGDEQVGQSSTLWLAPPHLMQTPSLPSISMLWQLQEDMGSVNNGCQFSLNYGGSKSEMELLASREASLPEVLP